jgi:hypothetical protein
MGIWRAVAVVLIHRLEGDPAHNAVRDNATRPPEH